MTEDGSGKQSGVRRVSQVHMAHHREEDPSHGALRYAPESPLCLERPQCLGAFRATTGQVMAIYVCEGSLRSMCCLCAHAVLVAC